jgi:hypothetical protein
MAKGIVIFLTVLVGSLAYALLRPGQPLSLPLGSATPKGPEVARQFAEHLETDPRPLQMLRHPAESGSEAPPVLTSKQIQTKPLPEQKETRTLVLKSKNEKVQFENREDWARWLHEGSRQQGARFLDNIAWEPDPTGYIEALEALSQNERDPTQLQEITAMTIESALRLQAEKKSPAGQRILQIMEHLLILQTEPHPARDQLEQLINHYR